MEIINNSILNEKTEIQFRKIINEICEKYYNEISKNVKGIKIIERGIIHKDISTRWENGYIVIPVNKIEGLFNGNEKEINLIKSNIIHEIYHAKLENELPRIHQQHKEACNKEDYIKAYTIIVYIEYLAHLESVKFEPKESINDYFESINKYNWDFSQDESKIFLIKHASYIITRSMDERVINKNYIANLRNYELREEIKNIKAILHNIEIVDDYEQLLSIENIVKRYITNE